MNHIKYFKTESFSQNDLRKRRIESTRSETSEAASIGGLLEKHDDKIVNTNELNQPKANFIDSNNNNTNMPEIKVLGAYDGELGNPNSVSDIKHVQLNATIS